MSDRCLMCGRKRDKCRCPSEMPRRSAPSPAPAAPGSGEDDWEEPSGNHCACVFDPDTGKQLQQCSTHATLTAENERLKAEYCELAGIAEGLLEVGRVMRYHMKHIHGCHAHPQPSGNDYCYCPGDTGYNKYKTIAAEYAAHLAKGKP